MRDTGFVLRGVVAASITPMKADGSIDFDRLEKHMDFLVEGGCAGVLVLGGCGEYVSLTQPERKDVVSTAVNAIRKRIPVIVGGLSPGTREIIEVA
jgi:4-hydroxy-tetrahydrodipicolinate synthase